MEWKSFEEFKSILVTINFFFDFGSNFAYNIEYFKCNWDWLRHFIYDYILD